MILFKNIYKNNSTISIKKDFYIYHYISCLHKINSMSISCFLSYILQISIINKKLYIHYSISMLFFLIFSSNNSSLSNLILSSVIRLDVNGLSRMVTSDVIANAPICLKIFSTIFTVELYILISYMFATFNSIFPYFLQIICRTYSLLNDLLGIRYFSCNYFTFVI